MFVSGHNLVDWLSEADKAKSLSKLRKNWHASTKGTLIRKYRVPSKAEGRKCLHALGDFLSEGDNGFDASTHKVHFEIFFIGISRDDKDNESCLLCASPLCPKGG